MSKRGNGEGSISPRKDGRWEAAITLPDGRRKRLYGKTRREVAGKLREAQNLTAQGLPLPSARLTVAAYLDRWLEAARPTIRTNTYAGYESAIRLHVKPGIGRITLSRLGPADLAALYARLETEGLSKRSIQLTHAILGRALKQAERWGDIARNPARLVDPPRPPRHVIRPLAPAEIQELLDAARGTRLEALYVLAVTTGLRVGELLGLRWADIDLIGETLHVRQQVQRLPRRLLAEGAEPWDFREPKTGAGRRSVALPTLAVDALRAHRVRQAAERLALGPMWDAALDLVFANEMGRPIERQNLVRRSFRSLIDAVDARRVNALGRPLESGERFPRIRFHDLRHSAATLLLSEGVHPKVVQERLGHATIAVTMDIYSHVLPNMQREAASKLDAFFGAG